MGGAQLHQLPSCPQMDVCAYRNASCGYDGAWIGSGGGVALNWKMCLSVGAV